MSILSHEEVLKLHKAALSARLFERREALFAGIARAFVASISVASTAAAQMLVDLHELNRVEMLADGSVPLQIWLKNASALATSIPESELFTAVLRRILPPGARGSDADSMSTAEGLSGRGPWARPSDFLIAGAATYSARAEAQPVTWAELTEHQKEAARQVCGILGDLAAQPWRPAPDKPRGLDLFLPAIDVDRRNHVVLIDGGRGSGKTALLMTLLYAWSTKLRNAEPVLELPPPELLPDKHRVVPIGLIDLQPLPKSTNLLVDLVGQLVRVVEAIESDGREKYRAARPTRAQESAPWHAMESEDSNVSLAWRRFLEAAAAWDTDLRGRRANLDLEAYAVEVEQGRKRLDATTRCFRALGDALVDAYMDWMRLPANEPPLFVVAVDDADMNPDRVREVLDLVRTLWHPRVAFLLTGDSPLFCDVLAKKLEAANAEKLAQQIYGKAIPPPHRCVLRDATRQERARILRGTLEALPAPPHPWIALSNLGQYLAIQRGVAELLPAKLRELRDLEQVLRRRAASGAWLIADLSGHPRLVMGAWQPSDGHTENLPSQGGGGILYQYDFRISIEGSSTPSAAVEAVHWDCAGGFGQSHRAGQPPGYAGFVARAWMHGQSVTVPWPLPDLDRPLDYAILSHLLNRACGIEGDPETTPHTIQRPDVVAFAQRFVHIVLGYGEMMQLSLGGSKRVGLDALEAHVPCPTTPPSWKDLADRCVRMWSLGTGTSPESPEAPVSDWAIGRAGLLATPESGLPPGAANEWLEALRASFVARDRADWEECTRRLRAERLRRLESQPEQSRLGGHGTSAATFLSRLDAERSDYTWSTELDPAPEAMEESLRVALAGVPVAPRGFPLPDFAFYFRPNRRLETLRTASRRTIRQWLESIERYRESDASAQLLVKSLIRAASEHDEAPAALARLNVDTISLSGYLRQLAGGREPWCYTGTSPAAGTAVGTKLRVAEAAYGWTPETGLRGMVAGALAEVAWDVAADAENMLSEPPPVSFVSPWWTAVGASYEDSARTGLLPWPAVEWPALLDQLLLANAWNRRVVSLVGEPASLSTESNHLADAVALWFMKANVRIARGRTAEGVLLNLGATMDEWKQEYLAVQHEASALLQRRGKALREWTRRYGLLAAPESGLSREAANVILEAHTSRNYLYEIGRLRRERLEWIGVPEGEVSGLLKRIDDANPGYRWRDVFKAEASPGEGSGSSDASPRPPNAPED